MLDWNKLNDQKDRLEAKLSKRGGGPSAKFWRPRAGKNTIRVLPAWTTEGNFAGQFWREVAQHWGVSEEQSGPILCPRETPFLEGSDECPICDFVDELRKDKSDVRAQELVKNLRAKTAYFLSIIDLTDKVYTANDVAEFKQSRPDSDIPFEVGDTKVQVYAAPATVFNAILNIMQTNELDVTDPVEGRDISLTKTGKGLTTSYETSIIIKPSKAPECKSVALDEIGYVMELEKMQQLLDSGPGGDFVASLAAGSSTPALASTGSGDAVDELRAQMEAALNG